MDSEICLETLKLESEKQSASKGVSTEMDISAWGESDTTRWNKVTIKRRRVTQPPVLKHSPVQKDSVVFQPSSFSFDGIPAFFDRIIAVTPVRYPKQVVTKLQQRLEKYSKARGTWIIRRQQRGDNRAWKRKGSAEEILSRTRIPYQNFRTERSSAAKPLRIF